MLTGTLKKAKMGFFHKGRYQPIDMAEPLEIVSCMGNLSIKEGEPHVHAHIAVSNLKGEVFGGHVLPGCVVSATGELVLIEAVDGSYKESWMIKPNYICGRWVGNILKWNPSVFPVLLAVKSVCAAIF